jgi:hypothetical protein
VLFVIYISILWVTNALLYSHIGFTYKSVTEYYLGSEESFRPPRTYQGMLEISHFHFFAMGILLLTLTHLVLFVPLPPERKPWLIVVPFVSALVDEGSGWLVRFVHPLFAYVKIAGFLALEISLAVLICLSLWAVTVGSQQNYRAQPAMPTSPDEPLA